MDVSVVAAVGSFFMSEKVLKPKATILVVLGMILAYDLTTKTHDVSSLRVYRGKFIRRRGNQFYHRQSILTRYRTTIICRPCIGRLYAHDVCLFLADLETEWCGL